jgi:hypothetical protein
MSEARAKLIAWLILLGISAIIGTLVAIRDSGIPTCHEAYMHDYADRGTNFDMGESTTATTPASDRRGIDHLHRRTRPRATLPP